MKNKEKRVIFGILFLIFVGILSSILSGSPSMYQGESINENYLEDLRLKAKVECLQSLQCSEGYECINNKCRDKNSINVCQDTVLSTTAVSLKVGDSLNSGKRALSYSDLPYLLEDGKILEIIDDNITEYLYSPLILINDDKIEKENQDHLIKPKSGPGLIIYIFSFSKNVDFSNKNIQGQVLRILGEEYIIGDDSTNSIIYLISDNKRIRLEGGKNVETKEGLVSKVVEGASVNMIKDEKGIAMFEIVFGIQGNINNNKNNIKVGENYIDPVFNTIKLSFNNIQDGLVDVRIGGQC